MILAIDLGNEYGWAVKQSASTDYGWERLTSGSKNNPGKKFQLFEYWLRELNDIELTAIYYELVQWNNGASASRAHSGYIAVLQMYAYRREIPCEGVAVKTIKKYWTGNGRATKEMMIAEANKRGFETDNDNCADALALLHYVIKPS